MGIDSWQQNFLSRTVFYAVQRNKITAIEFVIYQWSYTYWDSIEMCIANAQWMCWNHLLPGACLHPKWFFFIICIIRTDSLLMHFASIDFKRFQFNSIQFALWQLIILPNVLWSNQVVQYNWIHQNWSKHMKWTEYV